MHLQLLSANDAIQADIQMLWRPSAPTVILAELTPTWIQLLSAVNVRMGLLRPSVQLSVLYAHLDMPTWISIQRPSARPVVWA
jgi:hypothetical protein